MTNQFTTLEFADLLKQHGIEIDTPFYLYLRQVYAIHELDNGEIIAVNVDNKERVSHRAKRLTKNYVPCYLLSQVLGWLPEYVKGGNYPLQANYHEGGWEYSYRYYSYYRMEDIVLSEWQSLEDLFKQGLTEGWLSKEIIEQQVNQNL